MINLTKYNRAIYRIRYLLFLSFVFTLLSAGVAQAQDRARKQSQSQVQKANPTGVVNINTATEAELVRLPGIGPSKAQAILKLRGRMGGFSKVENLLRVRGIGRKTLQKLRPMLTLKGETTLVASKPSKKKSKKAK
jgi:competence protein ComEA